MASCFFNAQTPDWIWAKSAGGTSNDNGNDVTTDQSGNAYTTGRFTSDIFNIGDTSLTNEGNSDFFLAKHDKEGNFLWAKSVGGSGFEEGKKLSSDNNGNIYVLGYFTASFVFESTTLTHSGSDDLFLAKYDTIGNLIWVKSAGGTKADHIKDLTTDVNGNVYIAGVFFSADIGFDNDTLTNSNTNLAKTFIVKYDSTGNVIWAKTVEGNNSNACYGIATDSDGNLYVTGTFSSPSASFEGVSVTNASNTGYADLFLVKYNVAGDVVWAKRFGGNYSDIGNTVKINANDELLISGEFSSYNISFGSTTLTNATTNGTSDVFIVKLDTFGNVIWANGAGGTDYENIYSMDTDPNGNTYLVGEFESSTITFGDTTLFNAVADDLFIVKFDNNGLVKWAMSFDILYVNGINVNPEHHLMLAGFLTSPLVLGSTSLNSEGLADLFIAKLDTCIPKLFSQSFTICNGQFITVGTNSYSESGTYIDTLQALNTCDSIVTTILNIIPTTFTQNISICSGTSITIGNNIYSMEGTYIDTLQASISCDSILTTHLTLIPINFSQNVTICEGESITIGNNTYFLEGSYIDTLTSIITGCDSVIATNLSVLPVSSSTQSYVICDNESITVGNNTYTISGVFTDTLIALNGCDSIVTTNLVVHPRYNIYVDTIISSGGSYNVGTNSYTENGVYVDTLISINNCDSIITTNLSLLTDLKNLNNEVDFIKISPNPFVDYTILTFSTLIEKGGLEIYDIYGKKVQNDTITLNDTIKIERKNLASGVYYIHLKLGEKLTHIKKVILIN